MERGILPFAQDAEGRGEKCRWEDRCRADFSLCATRRACLSSQMMSADPLISRLKTLVVQTLKLDDLRPEDIPDHEPLFGSPRFGLDSIDALELVVQVEKEFGVKIGSSEQSRAALASIATLAAYIRSQNPSA